MTNETLEEAAENYNDKFQEKMKILKQQLNCLQHIILIY
jgi:hypothetical protein